MSESTTAGLRPAEPSAAAQDATIRPFQVSVSEEELADLRRRIAATHWPSKEPVQDWSQGIQLATLQALARYWAGRVLLAPVRGQAERAAAVHDRDRRARHPPHPRKSPHENALPLVITHG